MCGRGRGRALAFAGCSLLAVAACGDVGSESPAAVPAPTGTPAPALQAVVAASQLTVGLQRFPVGVLDHNTPVSDATVHVQAYFAAAGSSVLKGESDAPFKGEGLEGRGLYVARLSFDAAGQWLAVISVQRPGRPPVSVPAPFRVLTAASVPTAGQPAIKSRNQTIKDVPDVSYIDSGSPPDDMHTISIADAIAQHHPALVVFATPAFCTSATCGPQVHAVQLLEPAYRDRLAFIHVEIYRDFKPDPARRQLTPTVLEWHLQTEPWVFLIDRSGIIRAVFESTAATDELRQAADQMLAS